MYELNYNFKENKFICARDVTFDEENVRYDNQIVAEERSDMKEGYEGNNSENADNDENLDEEVATKAGSKVKLPSHLNEYEVYTACYPRMKIQSYMRKLLKSKNGKTSHETLGSKITTSTESHRDKMGIQNQRRWYQKG